MCCSLLLSAAQCFSCPMCCSVMFSAAQCCSCPMCCSVLFSAAQVALLHTCKACRLEGFSLCALLYSQVELAPHRLLHTHTHRCTTLHTDYCRLVESAHRSVPARALWAARMLVVQQLQPAPVRPAPPLCLQ
jgi:hypothetical protein